MNTSEMMQMFTAPEEIQKTAAYDDNQTQTQHMEQNKNGKKTQKDNVKNAINVMVTVLGVSAIFIMIIALLVFVSEIIRIFVLWNNRRRIESMEQDKRVRALEKKMYKLLKMYGIEAGLSWNTKDTDAAISGMFKDINPGEYINACRIIESNIYGDLKLAIYQERTLTAFIMKLYEAGKLLNPVMRLKLHYFV